MFLSASKIQLKSILPTAICSYRSALGTRGRKCQTIFRTFPARAVATKPLNNVSPAGKPVVLKKPPPTTTAGRLAPDATDVRDAHRNRLAQELAQNGNVLLYQAQSHVGFLFAAWVGGASCLGGALLILNLKLYEANKELPWFVPGAYRMTGVFLVAISVWSIARSSRLIYSIQLLAGNGNPRLLLKIRRNLPLPFVKPREMTVLTSDVTLKRRMVAPMGRPPQVANLDRGYITSIPSRIGAALSRFFASARQFVFSDGIVKVSVEGRGGIWKLDSNGLFLDGGNRLWEVVKFVD